MWPLLLACASTDGWTLPKAQDRPGDATDDPTDTADSGGEDTSVDDTAPDDTAPDPCDAIAPSGSDDRAAIQACLDAGHATLSSGAFWIGSGLLLPPGGRLTGAGATATEITLGGPDAGYLLQAQGQAEIADLKLDGADQLVFTYTNSIINLLGDDNHVHDVWIGNEGGTSVDRRTVGVYFVDPAGTGNLVERAELTGTFYGAIFVAGLPVGSDNRLQDSVIHEIRCDSVTLVGYGEVVGNSIYNNGWDCENGPIPGGGIYSLWNTTGGLIQGNAIADNCGHGIDLDGVQNFVIDANTVYDPGNTWDGWASWCGGAMAISMVDSSANTVSNNIAQNVDRPWNGANANPLFAPSGGSAWSDLPGGSTAIMAFLLAQRPTAGGTAIANVVTGNQFVASCSSGCVGVGWFASRGTGYDAAYGWSAETTNYFTANDPFGSNVGSTRCGGNWYAADANCPSSGYDSSCNTDDWQHTADWARNDGCSAY